MGFFNFPDCITVYLNGSRFIFSKTKSKINRAVAGTARRLMNFCALIPFWKALSRPENTNRPISPPNVLVIRSVTSNALIRKYFLFCSSRPAWPIQPLGFIPGDHLAKADAKVVVFHLIKYCSGAIQARG